MKRILLGLILFFFFSSFLFAQYTVEVRFAGNPPHSTYAGTIERNGILFVSLNDVAEIFKLDMYINKTTEKIELKGDSYLLKSTANSPFVVVSDRSNASVVQLPLPVLFAAGSLFAPLEGFVPILDIIVPEKVLFNRSLKIIGVDITPEKQSFDVVQLTIEDRANGCLVRIHSKKEIKDYESWLKPITSGSANKGGEEYWLYVTLADATVDTTAIANTKPTGFVREIVAFQSPTSAQLTMRLRGEITGTELLQAEGGNDLLLTIHTPSAEQLAARRQREIEKNLERERAKWKLDVIVIDAGHGGKDPGTIGVARTREKDVTLAIALKLGKLLEQRLPGVTVVYTRKGDEYIELYRRGQIANQAGGKLFISVHCNSMPRKPHPAGGFEIYLLRPGKTEHALKIAERENSVVQFEEDYQKRYQELTEENFIIMTMAQSAYVKYSEQFADVLQQEMSKRLQIENNGLKQAGFYVLVGASMPNVLVETAYLSNRQEEKILKSAKGQQKIADAIFQGVKRYKNEYEKSLEEGKLTGSD